MIRRRQRFAPARGFSLVEMAVVLVVMGVIGVVMWRMLPLAPQVAAGDIAARELAQAEQALLGYVLAHSRLPTPAIENGVGVLPVDAMGLPASLKFRYQVQPSLTVSPGDEFVPLLPPAVGAVPATPVESLQVNGLDFCMALKDAGGLSLVGLDNVPAAFALMHGGPVGHDRQTAAAFALPGSPTLGERKVLAVGPGEFASRLGCPERVSRTHGAARAAYVAYDLVRVANEYEKMRVFAERVAAMNLKNAETGELFAGFDVAFGILMETLAILQEAAGWPPDAVGIAVGIASHVTATTQLGLAIDNLVSATADVDDAHAAQDVARAQTAAATANVDRMEALADGSLQQALTLDEAGLQP